MPAVDTGSAWARRIYERRLAENESSSKKLDTAGCQPTNKGRSDLHVVDVLVPPRRVLAETSENHFLEVALDRRDDAVPIRGMLSS